MYHRFFIYTVLIFCCLRSVAQTPLYTHQQLFKVEDGLPQSFISGIVQDKDGFIWIATLDGLARYDGRGFKVFRQQRKDTNSLSSNVINLLAKNKYGHFWIKYQGQQVDNFDPVTFSVRHAGNNPLLQNATKPNNNRDYDYHSTTWVFTIPGKGIGWIDTKNGVETYANRSNGKLMNDTIVSLLQEDNGVLWLVSPAGIHRSDSAQQHFEWMPFRIPVRYDPGTFVQTIFVEKMMVIGLPDRLLLIDVDAQKISTITIPPGKINGIDFPMNSLQKDSHGELYFRSSGRIFRLEKNGNLTLIWENNVVKGRRITSFFVDRSDVLWVGIDAGGLAKINLRSMPFMAGHYQYNFHTDVLTQAGIPLKSLPELWIKSKWSYNFRYAYGTDSALYICNVDSIFSRVYCWQKNKFFPLSFPAGKSAHFRGLYAGSEGSVWALDNYNYGIWYWKDNRSNPVFIPVELPVNARRNFFADLLTADDFQWITTYGKGLFQLAGGKGINHYEKSSGKNALPFDLTDLCADPKDPDKFWIGSLGGGMILWDTKTGVKKIFTTEDGLPNNTVYCIVADKNGLLWLSTNKGICRFNTADFTTHNFEKTDGLSGNEFNRFHKFQFPDDRIAFGGPDGYTVFNPADFKLKKDNLQAGVQITGVQINNQLQDLTTRGSYIEQPYNQLRKLTLPYNRNYVTVEFVSLLFNEPQKIRYRYKLTGVDDDWNEGSRNFAQYTQLRPGNYKLLMNATDIDGRWSSNIRQLSIHIYPPFWRSWWAYGLYALAGLVLVRTYWRYNKKRILEQQQLVFEQLEARRLRELDQVKDRFFANITHEFRTPLTLITTPLERLGKDAGLSDNARQTVMTVQRNAGQMLRLINQLLDLSKLEAGQMRLVQSIGELKLFVEEMVDSFKERAKEKSIQLVFSSTGIEGIYRFDRDKWEIIISNLLSNALKFTPFGGTIHVFLEGRDSENATPVVRFIVEDSGPGIPPADLEKIFNRFYQSESAMSGGTGGTGIGLSLVKELIKLMHGTIHVENKKESGAKFIVEMPFSKIEPGEEIPVETATVTEAVLMDKTSEKLVQREDPLILIVEDSGELRSYVLASLSEKWRSLAASDGTVGWDLILQEMPDVVVSDVMMPGKDGFELCSLCKTDSRTAHIGFILLTSKAAHAARIEGLETGADDYITKPFHQDELELRIQNLLQLQEKNREFLKSQLLPRDAGPTIPVKDDFINQLYSVIENKLDDPLLSVEYLAKTVGMSRSSLNRKLNALLDISANDLIRGYRLQKGAAYLTAGHDISGTAYRVGFASPSYFAKCFKDEYGLTPSEFISKSALGQN